MVDKSLITGIVLAGGRASRMGGVDKGLQVFMGKVLVENAIARLRPQVADLFISANRHLDTYQKWGLPVLADKAVDFAGEFPGPLAGFLTGLERCTTPYLMTAPCDTPHFPMDMVQRMSSALQQHQADIAMACSPDETGKLCNQPVFCLIKRDLAPNLRAFLTEGGRKIGAWTALHAQIRVPFNLAHDEPRAFNNMNTLSDLQA